MWIADPRAINHILHKGGYNYGKSKDEREQARLITDHSVGWADGEGPRYILFSTLVILLLPQGEVHKRHRRAMTPAFGALEIKNLLPSFLEFANKVCPFTGPLACGVKTAEIKST